MPCTIRPRRAQDQADWRRLWTGYLAFYQTSVPEAVCQSTCARLLRTAQHDFNCLVAEVDGKVIGLTHSLLYQRPFQLTCAQARVVMEAMALGSLARKFQALQQASTMSS